MYVNIICILTQYVNIIRCICTYIYIEKIKNTFILENCKNLNVSKIFFHDIIIIHNNNM